MSVSIRSWLRRHRHGVVIALSTLLVIGAALTPAIVSVRTAASRVKDL